MVGFFPYMLIIRREQMEVFEAAALKRFEEELLEHTRRCFPVVYRTLGGAPCREVIQCGLRRAAAHELTAKADICLYVSTMYLLGSYFDEDELLPWIPQLLDARRTPSPGTRAKKLFEKTVAYRKVVAGPDSEHLKRVLTMLHGSRLEDFGGADVTGKLREIYPEKCAAVGDAALNQAIRSGLAACGRHGLTGSEGITFYLLLMLLFGTKFETDPLIPWVLPILEEDIGGEAKSRRLHSRAHQFANACLD